MRSYRLPDQERWRQAASATLRHDQAAATAASVAYSIPGHSWRMAFRKWLNRNAPGRIARCVLGKLAQIELRLPSSPRAQSTERTHRASGEAHDAARYADLPVVLRD